MIIPRLNKDPVSDEDYSLLCITRTEGRPNEIIYYTWSKDGKDLNESERYATVRDSLLIKVFLATLIVYWLIESLDSVTNKTMMHNIMKLISYDPKSPRPLPAIISLWKLVEVERGGVVGVLVYTFYVTRQKLTESE